MHTSLAVLLLPFVAYAVANRQLPSSTLFPSPTSTRPEQVTTSAPVRHQHDLRQVNSICGFYFEGAETFTISCSAGIPCTADLVGSDEVVYCSTPGGLPITSVYGYGEEPVGGCLNGQLCCPSSAPAYGAYLFDNGPTVLLACGLEQFTVSATDAIDVASPSVIPTPISSNQIIPTPTPPSPSPSPTSTSTSSGSLGPGPWAAIGVSVFFGLLSAAIGIGACVSGIFRDRIRHYASVVCCGHCQDPEAEKQSRAEELRSLRSPDVHGGGAAGDPTQPQPRWMAQGPPAYEQGSGMAW